MSSPDHHELAKNCQISYTLKTYSVNEVDAFVINHKDYYIIAFTGTEAGKLWPWDKSEEGISNWKDIRADLRFVRHDHPEYGRVHRGFIHGATRWCNMYKGRFDKKKPIYLTGHSKGAGEATQAARILFLEGYNIAEVVLFAEPSGHYIGSRKHFDSLGMKVTSYIYGNDIIRFLPPWGRRSTDTTKIGPWRFWPSIKDHDVTNYVKATGALKYFCE